VEHPDGLRLLLEFLKRGLDAHQPKHNKHNAAMTWQLRLAGRWPWLPPKLQRAQRSAWRLARHALLLLLVTFPILFIQHSIGVNLRQACTTLLLVSWLCTGAA
jgi:hypothetical protein